MSSLSLATRATRLQDIYLAARTAFSCPQNNKREFKAVDRIVSQYEKDFSAVIVAYGRQRVISIIVDLLDKQAFTSKSTLQELYPTLNLGFQAETIKTETADHHTYDLTAITPEVAPNIHEQEHTDDLPTKEGTALVEHNVPSLFPTYVSYGIQHKLLNAVQKLLEESCYDLAAREVPDLMVQFGWDCAEAVEITSWREILAPQLGCLDATRKASGQDLLEALEALKPLRRAAVHRIPTPSREVAQMLKCALRLVQILQDEVRMTKLEDIINVFLATKRDMKFHKYHLEDELLRQLQTIQEQRAALDRDEEEAKKNMIRQDLENTKSISSLLGTSLDSLIQGGPLRIDCREAEPEAHLLDHHTNNDVKATALACHDGESITSNHADQKNQFDAESKSEELEIQGRENAVSKDDLTLGNKVEPKQPYPRGAESSAFRCRTLQELIAAEGNLEHNNGVSHESEPDVPRDVADPASQLKSVQSSPHNVNGKRNLYVSEENGGRSEPVQDTERATKRRAISIDNIS